MPLERVGQMVVLAALQLGRSALRAVLVVEAGAMALCRMLVLDRGSTSRRRPTNMWVSEEISM